MSSHDNSWCQMATEELLRATVEKARTVRREYAELLGMIAELVNRGAPAECGYGSPERMVTDLIRVGRAEAHRTVTRAVALHPTTNTTGAPQPAALPATAEAAAAGELSTEHLDRMVTFNDDLPADVDHDARRAAEQELADLARTSPPHGLTRRANELTAQLDPDAAARTDAELLHPHHELRTTWQGDRFRVTGELDRETGMLLEAALSPLAAPRGIDGDPDTRSTPQRYGDAFAQLVEIAARSTELPNEGGPVTILLTMSEHDLRTRISAATTMDGHRIPVAQVRRMACDAGIIPTLLGRSGEALDMGSRARTAPASVRNRLIARDRGCAFPGCDRPPSQTQAHHVKHWADGGVTAPHNMVLVCAHHHRVLHHSQWTVHIGPDGLPEFTPPEYLGRCRTPRRQPRAA